MGRGNKNKNRGRKSRDANSNGWKGGGQGAEREIVRENERFESYYNDLEIVPKEERAEFWAAMKRDLPNSFRFTGSKGHALLVQRKLIEHFIPEISSVEYEGKKVDPPTSVSWYPANLAWMMTTPKNVVRKFPPFASFQKFLVSETGVGNVSRQELVSMIPPLVMDVRPGMTVLDLCAAPGSKSAQLIEMIHEGEETRMLQAAKRRKLNGSGSESVALEEDGGDDGRATGLLIANDSDQRRAQLLVHQVKRLNSPNFIVTNHDAAVFPSIQIPSTTGRPKYLKFDRILADVPCAGDGTCRKNYNVWKDWIPANGLGLHSLQTRILVRALQMLKVGGRVVYSTCSMNPIENEAVVCAAVEQSGGLEHVQLVDPTNMLNGLKRYPGLTTWTVTDKKYRIWSSWEEVQESLEVNDWSDARDKDAAFRLSESMFPPLTEGENTKIPIERCMRVYPHLQDTGGFFIAVLEKMAEIRPNIPAKTRSATNSKSSRTPKETAAEEADVEPVLEHLDRLISENGAGVKRAAEDDDDDDIEPSAKKLKPASPAPDRRAEPSMLEQMQGPDSTRNIMNPNRLRNHQMAEEPFKYLPGTHPAIENIAAYFGLDASFPRDRFMVRNALGDPVKSIYYTSALVRDILTLNEGKGIKFVQSGVKMFGKQDVQNQVGVCPWRIQTEGIALVEPYVGEHRVVRLRKRETLRKLLLEMFIKVSGDEWRNLDEVGEALRDLGMGCAILVVESDTEGLQERMVVPVWRAVSSVNLMLPKETRKAYLLREFNDETPIVDNSQLIGERKRAAAAAAAAVESKNRGRSTEVLVQTSSESEGESA